MDTLAGGPGKYEPGNYILARRMKQSIGSSEGAIFDAHLLILQDPELIKQARAGIDERHENAAFAWNAAITAAAESYRALDDPYLQARAADVEDVGTQVLFAMVDKTAHAPLTFDEPVILYAADLDTHRDIPVGYAEGAWHYHRGWWTDFT